MKTGKLTTLRIQLRSLAIFRDLMADPVMEALCRYLDHIDADTAAAVSAYSNFVAKLYASGDTSLAGYLQSAVNDNENPYIRIIGCGKQPGKELLFGLSG